MSETELKISRVGFPPFSARGCQQILVPIASGELRRTVNGQLLYLGTGTHHKFKTIITCEDKATFAFGQLWVGAEVEVSCAQRLWQEVTAFDDHSIQLLRPAVENTVSIHNLEEQSLPFKMLGNKELIIKATKESQGFISYCPLLNMRITNFTFTTQEWAGKCSWHLEMEEI